MSLILFLILFIPISESMIVTFQSESIFSKYQNLTHNNSRMVVKNNDESSSVQVDIDISGVSYGQELLWIANTTGINYEESAVVYSDGIAYIGSCSTHGGGHDRLFAVDTTNGTIIWSIFMGPTYVGPVIDDDRIYIAKKPGDWGIHQCTKDLRDANQH